MNIAHLDVDNYTKPYLKEPTYPHSLQNLDKPLKGAKIVTLTNSSQVNVNNLKKIPDVKFIITRTVGMDHINFDICKQQGIQVEHIVDYGASNIAEHVFALLLAGTRRIIDSQKEIKKGTFSYEPFLGFTLREKVLGVVGTGRIGLETIKIAQAFGMKIIAYDVYKNEKAAGKLHFRYVNLEKLFSASDVITLHAPLLESTRHIINEQAIEKMKEGVVLINTARGGLIDTGALIKYINKFRYIGLDVLEDEKMFDRQNALLKYNNVTITPHIAFYTDFTVKKIVEETYNLIETYVSNKK